MITWTQSGTTKSINNNNIVYAKQGADGEPVLVDRIIAVDTSTIPPTESVVYQSNSILRTDAVSSFYGPAAMGRGQCFYALATISTPTQSDYDIRYTGDYYWVQYPPINCPTSSSALTLVTKHRTNSNTADIGTRKYRYSTGATGAWTNAGGSIGSYYAGGSGTISGTYERTIPMNITYTYATPYRVVVKVTVGKNTIRPFFVGSNGYSPLIMASTGNNTITSEQILYDGIMDNVTRDYTFDFNTKYETMSWNVSTYDFNVDRHRGGLYYSIPNISRTIEIYDPNTGNLIASNTSALSTSWTARR